MDSDVVAILATAALAFAPGGAVLWAAGLLRGRRGLLLGLAAPSVTFGLGYLTAAGTTLLDLRFSPLPFLVAIVVVTVAVRALRGRAERRGEPPPQPGDRLRLVVGLGLTAVAVLLGLRIWLGGLGTLATPFQEFDPVVHTLLTAYIVRTGQASPWLALPGDVLTGDFASYYPAGLHSLAALGAGAAPDVVAALNGAVVVMCAVVLPVGLFALVAGLRTAPDAPVVGGVAAVFAVVSYRPVYQFMHDAGLLANVAAFALVPGLALLVLAVGEEPPAPDRHGRRSRRRGVRLPRHRSAAVSVAAVAVAGGFSVHPTSVAVAAATVLAWLVGLGLERRIGARELGGYVITGALAAFGGVALALPMLASAASGTLDAVAEWPREVEVEAFGPALRTVLAMPIRGYYDWESETFFQVVLAGLAIVGVLAAAFRRGYAPVLVGFFGWAGFLFLFLTDRAPGPLDLVANVFYNSYSRIDAALKPFQWFLAGVAVSSVVAGAVVLARRLVRWRGGEAVAFAAASVAMGALLAPAVLGYADFAEERLAARFKDADWRITDEDRAAFDFLAARVAPGERVMNNANDGSTYMYVYLGIPVVSVQPLVSSAPYFPALVSGLNRIDSDPEIRQLVEELDIGWVYVDESAPVVGIRPEYWWFGGMEKAGIPPGFSGLDDVAGLRKVYEADGVRIYEVL